MATALFIDGPNLYAASKTLGIDVDFKRLREYFKEGLVRAYYYTAILEDQEYISIRPLVDYLAYNGYQVVSKQAKQWTDADGRVKTKGNMDTEISIDAFELVVNKAINHAVFFTGDGDFEYLIRALQRHGCICTVVSSIVTKPPICADDLRRIADYFIDIHEIRQHIERLPGDRTERPERRRYG